MTVARPGLYVWVTWLAKLMAGEVQCHWAAHFRTRYMGYAKAPSDFQQAAWMVAHNQCLDELCRECSPAAVFKEDQNQFRVTRKSGMVISGKPDLIALDVSGGATVYDIKTGSPRHSDLIQVMLYMLFLPYGSPVYKGKKISGCVVYRDGERSAIPAAAIDKEFEGRVTYFLNLLEAADPPRRCPSATECRYCDLTRADCTERVEILDEEVKGGEMPF